MANQVRASRNRQSAVGFEIWLLERRSQTCLTPKPIKEIGFNDLRKAHAIVGRRRDNERLVNRVYLDHQVQRDFQAVQFAEYHHLLRCFEPTKGGCARVGYCVMDHFEFLCSLEGTSIYSLRQEAALKTIRPIILRRFRSTSYARILHRNECDEPRCAQRFHGWACFRPSRPFRRKAIPSHLPKRQRYLEHT